MKNLDFKNRIAYNFDLDQNVLLQHTKNPLKLYKQLENFLKKNDFDKRQQSSFLSSKKMDITEVIAVTHNINNEFDWFNESVNEFTATFENDIIDLIPIISEKSTFINFDNKQKHFISNSDEKQQIALHFDLKTKDIDRYFSSRSTPYYWIEKTMKNRDFIHQQRSGYISKNNISNTELFLLIKELKEQVPHFNDVIKCLDATHLENIWDLKPYIKDETLSNKLIRTASKIKNNQQTKKSIQLGMESEKEM